jgi:hypothetical protein
MTTIAAPKPAFRVIYDPAASTASVAAVSKFASPYQTPPKRRIDAQDLGDKAKLARILVEMSQDIGDTSQNATNNPFMSSVLIQGVPMTSGVPIRINHSLGRPYIGWMCVRAVGAAWSGYEPVSPTVPQNAQLQLVPGSTGTFSFVVF